MKQYISFIYLFFCFNSYVVSQQPNYTLYHSYINTAEKLFFIDNKADSSLYYYEKAFNTFDFIFVKDLVNAAQIAYFSNKPFKNYLAKGFDFGLKIPHLYSINLFKPIYNDLVNDKYLQKEYSIRREKYIKHIDFEYLSFVYKMYISDQLDKRKSKEEYDEIKLKDINLLRNKIKTKGFPSAKKIGIDDKTIFSEIGKPDQDIDILKTKFSDKLDYLSADEEILSSKFIFVILIHNKCAYNELSDLFKDLLMKGEIHPREIGLLYDNMYRNEVNTKKYDCKALNSDTGLFFLNMFCPYNQMFCSEDQSDLLREKWSIVPLAVDRAKKEYERLYGFKLFFGFWGCM